MRTPLTAAQAGRRHPLYRAIKIGWWIVAIWLSVTVLIGVIRGTFFTEPAPKPPAETSRP